MERMARFSIGANVAATFSLQGRHAPDRGTADGTRAQLLMRPDR